MLGIELIKAGLLIVVGIDLDPRGRAVTGAQDRQQLIPGFDQAVFSRSRVICVGAGGLISQVAPTLARKGIGTLLVLDDDEVEASNLNRQRFYPKDLGHNKAIALVENLQPECIATSQLVGYPMTFEEACEKGVDLSCDVAICGVDNNPARLAASRYFRRARTPVVFLAVSADADHGYVFVQETKGPCLCCLFPDLAENKTFPCLRTPAIADILQAVGALAVYAIDTCLMNRKRTWNYRRILLSDGTWDSSQKIEARRNCQQLDLHSWFGAQQGRAS